MGITLKPLPVKLIVGLIARDIDVCDKTQKILVKKFGTCDFRSPVLAFDKTPYYEKEMGSNLKRVFLSFEKLIPAEHLVSIKLTTNRLEQKLALAQSKRVINIDPGYISLSKLTLATTKSFVHRLYMGRGIFEEITLYFKDATFQPGRWTYPDYRSEDHIKIFNTIRDKYYLQIEKKYGLSQLYKCV